MNEVIIVDFLLLVLVAITAMAVVQVRSLFAAVILAGFYSLLMALVWSNMHALDVAFTEASVGAGISTILLLGAVVWTGRESKPAPLDVRALVMCIVTGSFLIYGTLDMPRFGDPDAPIHTLRVPKLLAQTVGKVETAPTYSDPNIARATQTESPKTTAEHEDDHHAHPDDDFSGHSPNTVTSLLAAYRGYDTMFETAVIFVAGISLVLLLRRREEDDEDIESGVARPPKPSAPVPDRAEPPGHSPEVNS